MSDVFTSIIREIYDADIVVSGHHIIYTLKDDPLPQEIPSADYIVFDHYIASKIWENNTKTIYLGLLLNQRTPEMHCSENSTTHDD